MEKRRPPYPLPEIKRLIRQGCYRATRTALFCAVRDFDLVDASEMAEWVLTSKRGKSVAELLALLEKDSISISEKEVLLKTFDIPDLVQIAVYVEF